MKIIFASTGPFKERSFYERFLYYKKLISAYRPVEELLIPVSKKVLYNWMQNPKSAATPIVDAVVHFLSHRPAPSYVVLLDERGRTFSSHSFAHFLGDKLGASLKEIVFLCPGPYGITKEQLVAELSSTAIDSWSLSPLIMPHELAQVVAIEQIYRAFSIMHARPYHHD